MIQMKLKMPNPIKIVHRGQTVHVLEYKHKVSQKEAYDEIQRVSNELMKNGKIKGGINASLPYPHYEYPTYITKIGHVIDSTSHGENYDDPEPDEFDGFTIYVYKNIFEDEGGADLYNDCLYNCLVRLAVKLPKSLDKPYKLKRFLGLKRDDKVSIKCLPALEKELEYYKFDVTGDYDYISTHDAQLVINLTLSKEHFKINTKKHPRGLKSSRIPHKPKIPYLFKVVENNKTIIYDPEIKKERELTKDEFNKIKYYYDESKYILVPTNKTNKKKKLSLEVLYKNFVNDADILKKESWRIDLYRTGTNYQTILKLFAELSKEIIPEPITHHEAYWLDLKRTGGITFCKPGTYEKIWDYDFNSFYASILAGGNCFPYKEGEFKQIKELPKVLRYGLYHCVIESDNIKFKTNWNDIYTHTEIYYARDLKLKIDLVIDDTPNALIWERDKLLLGSQMFGKYVKLLYPIKQKYGDKCPTAKLLLSSSWGTFSKKLTKKETVKLNEYDQYENSYTEDLRLDNVTHSKLNKNQYIFEYNYTNDKAKTFQTDYARMKPFLLAFARVKIAKTFAPYLDSIVYINTDGFYSTKQLPIKLGTGLGEIKEKVYTNMNIKNLTTKSHD